MNTIILIGIIQAAFLILLVANKKDKSVSDYILIVLLSYTALHQLFFLINFSDNLSAPFFLMIAGAGFPLLYGPILYGYVLSLISRERISLQKVFLHLFPYLLFVISFSWYHYQVEGALVSVYDGFLHMNGPFAKPMFYFSIYFAISGGAYPLVCLFMLHRHRNNIHREFSYEETINLKWLRLLIEFTYISFIISFFAILFIVDWNWNANPRVAFYIVSLIGTIFIFFIGYFGLKQSTIFTSYDLKKAENEWKPNTGNRYAKSGLSSGASLEIINKLDELMVEEKPFLNNQLTLQDLSSRLSVSTNHLSQSINENKKLSFFDYVNRARVEEVKKRITDPTYNHITLLGIGLDCGFNSKSSFNKIFKNCTGQTPSEFKKDQYKQEARPTT